MDCTPKLIILSEQFRGRTFELTKEEMVIGRVDQRDICIKDPTVSTNHCSVFNRNGVVVVVDNGSTNGTRINGTPITPGVEQELMNTDVLQVGGIEMLFDSDDKSVTTVMRTTTDININAGEGTQTIERIDPMMGFSRKRDTETTQKLFIVIIVILSLIVVGMLGYFLMSVMNGGKEKKSSRPPMESSLSVSGQN